MDKNCYPEEHELKKIRDWPTKAGYKELLEYINERWKYAEDGYWVRDGDKYNISTGGWSGNESLIGAMRENKMFWVLCWWKSKRGGHYEFRLPNSKQGKD